MTDIANLTSHLERELVLSDCSLPEEYFYSSPSLCVIDAVFSIGVRYEAVRNVVKRYCNHFDTRIYRSDRSILPEQCHQESISMLAERIRKIGAGVFSSQILMNRQRTSSKSGILKAEAVYQFADTLYRHGINTFQDISQFHKSDDENRKISLNKSITAIPGQRSGISLDYFWMLSGSDDLIKADRMITRFLEGALGCHIDPPAARDLLRAASTELQKRYPSMSPRLLDYKIWEYQRAIRRSAKDGRS